MTSLCQICGARFSNDDLDRNPLSHFCIGLDGPAIVHLDEISAPHTPEYEKPKKTGEPQSIALGEPRHAKEDLLEIAKLHREVEMLRAKLRKGLEDLS